MIFLDSSADQKITNLGFDFLMYSVVNYLSTTLVLHTITEHSKTSYASLFVSTEAILCFLSVICNDVKNMDADLDVFLITCTALASECFA
jgi:hypothetical protein